MEVSAPKAVDCRKGNFDDRPALRLGEIVLDTALPEISLAVGIVRLH